jgi:misacylated tRNA(Ala) deacylase
MLKTQPLYKDDSYCFEHQARVTGLIENAVILDRSCMYPGGGGQPPDTGNIFFDSATSIKITNTFSNDQGAIFHVSADPVPHDVIGRNCHVKLNSKRRIDLMRYHTALHVFNTVMLRMFDGWITGVSIGEHGSHIDFKIEAYKKEMVDALELEINRILERALNIKSFYLTSEEFNNRPDLIRTLDAKPPIESGRVRVVEIEGYEAQACGGTHVRNTSEVGMFSIVKVRSKGKNNRRFYVSLKMQTKEL